MDILGAVKTAVVKTKFWGVKNAPGLLLGAGIACAAAGVYSACKSTLNVDAVIEEEKENLEKIESHNPVEHPELSEKYTKKQYIQDLIGTWIRMIFKLGKHYWKSLFLLLLSLFFVLKSFGVLNNRLAVSSMIATQTAKEFSAYRQRIAERFGEETEKDIRYGVQKQKVSEVDENGKKVKREYEVTDPNAVNEFSLYSIFFDEYNKNWHKDPVLNREWLECKMREANNLYFAQGKKLFLYQVYEILDHKLDPRRDKKLWDISHAVGWDGDLPDAHGYIDFIMKNVKTVGDFREGVLIDFNVDGNILTSLNVSRKE